jgi:hypothetical protein
VNKAKTLAYHNESEMMAMAQPRSVAASVRQSIPPAFTIQPAVRPCSRGAVLARSVTADKERVQLPTGDPEPTQDQELDAYFAATTRLQQLLTDAALR